MKYIPNTKEQKEEMLKEIGVSSFEEIIKVIPEDAKLKREINLPHALSEQEIVEHIESLSDKNFDFKHSKPLCGGGSYRHYIPEAVKAVLGHSEFYTAYTPYQPELSQGTLQTMFEVQTHLSNLTGMDVVVPSLYDGASATAEAALMALRITKKNKILVSDTIHPQYLETVKTYIEPHKINIEIANFKNFVTDLEEIEKNIGDDTAAIIVQSPNFFGGIEDLKSIAEISHRKGILLVQVIDESLSLAILKTPFELGADIVAGEAQSFGIDLSFGGPYNGFLGTKNEFVRQLPGRIVGETVDNRGQRAFVMTLRAREQDIKREKATSNICSNHNLNLFAINAYISLYGKEGLFELAVRNIKASHYLRERLLETGIFEKVDYPFFNEFTLKTNPDKIKKIKARLINSGFIPPIDASYFFSQITGYLIFAATEIFSREELDRVSEIVRG